MMKQAVFLLFMIATFAMAFLLGRGDSRVTWADDKKAEGTEEEEDEPILKIMEAIKKGKKSIRDGMRKKDKERVAESAAAMAKVCKGLGELYPVKDDKEGTKDFATKGAALVKSVEELADLAKKTRFTDDGDVKKLNDHFTRKLGETCVACHNAYWVTFQCESHPEDPDKTWSQAKWEEKKPCSFCKKKGCGKRIDNEEE